MIIRTHTSDDGTRSRAIYTDCELYRYVLTRRWGAKSGNRIAFVGLNPSTATEVQNDPTVARCINYAKSWGYDAMTMLNAYAYRSTDPQRLKQIDDPVGSRCDHFIREQTQAASRVILCWGTHAAYLDRHAELLQKLRRWQRVLHCLKITKGGYPWHPLYLSQDLSPIPFEADLQGTGY